MSKVNGMTRLNRLLRSTSPINKVIMTKMNVIKMARSMERTPQHGPLGESKISLVPVIMEEVCFRGEGEWEGEVLISSTGFCLFGNWEYILLKIIINWCMIMKRLNISSIC